MGKITECSYYDLIPQGSKIIVGLSGGADSMVLLDSLHKQGYMCIAAHCNFHLRSEESNRDAMFAYSQAKLRNIPFFRVDFQTDEYASIRKISTEMAARELRYKWFAELRERVKADVIAVAHHADDCIETMLINLSRGTGLKGLAGIKAKQGNIVRPLLKFTKEDILQYVSENSLEYVDDSTNFESVYVRNKFRNQVIPLLEQINPSIRKNLITTMEHLRETEQFITHQITPIKGRILQPYNGGYKISINEILQSPDSRFILYECISDFGFSSDVIDNLLRLGTDNSGKHFFSSRYELRCERETWEILPIRTNEEKEFLIREIDDVQNLPIHLSIRAISSQEVTIKPDSNCCYVDKNKISFPLTLRHCKIGDYFIPFGMKGRKKTSDFFIDNHYSQFQKENSWVLTTSKGEIIWLVGKRADNRFRIDDTTQETIIFSIE